MGIIIKDNNASYRAGAMGMVFPIDNTGLELLSVFGGTLAESSRNFAPGKSPLSAAGAPTVNANSIVLDSGKYLQTSMADNSNLTLIVIGRALTEEGSLIFSNYGSPSQTHAGVTSGASIYSSVGTAADGKLATVFQRAKNVGGVSTLVSASSVQVNVNEFHFMCGRLDGAVGIRKFNDMTAGVATVSAADTTQFDLGGAFRLGFGYGATGSFTGQTEMVAAIGLSRAISDAELTSLYQFWKGYCARRGIVI